MVLGLLGGGGGGGGLGGALGGLGTGIGGLIGLLDKSRGGKRYLKDILNLYQNLQLPQYDTTDLSAPYIPFTGGMETINAEAALPGDASLIADSPALRAQQLEALGGLGQIAQEGLPEADRLAAEEAARSVRGALRSGEENQIQNLRRRGRLGGGGEIAARAVGGRLASELGRGLASDLQRQALERRLQAIRDYGSAAGAVRGQDVTSQLANADALNRFKIFAASNKQATNLANQAAAQNAQQYNVSVPQQLAAQNVQNQFQTNQYNQAYGNQMANQAYQDQLKQAAGMAGAYGSLADAAYAKQAAKQKTYENIFGGLGQGIGGIGDAALKYKTGGGLQLG